MVAGADLGITLATNVGMPTTSELLSLAERIANDTLWLAVLWHAVLLGALLAFLTGWRPRRAIAMRLLALPVASVALVNFVAQSPFNGLVFATLAVVMIVLATRMTDDEIERAPDWQITAGHAFLAFGAFYPHFLDGSPLWYAVGAPFGLLPCPTLAVLAGFTLIASGFSRAWTLTLTFLTVFYGVLGVVQLGVTIDVVLVLMGFALAGVSTSLAIKGAANAPRSFGHASRA